MRPTLGGFVIDRARGFIGLVPGAALLGAFALGLTGGALRRRSGKVGVGRMP